MDTKEKSVLNRALYRRCKASFGQVKIHGLGEKQIRVKRYDKVTGKHVIDITYFGEAYAVCCPLCADTRFRCYINHRYGTKDEFGFQQFRLIHCFNGGCLLETNPSEAFDRMREILTGHTPYVLANAQVREGKEVDLDKVRSTWPGEVIRVDKLPDDHEGKIYLIDRGFDPEIIGRFWNVHFCVKSTKIVAQDRLIIPIYHDKKMVGWQSRAPYDCDWKKSPLPKYYTAPGTPRRQVLYNLGNANKCKTGIVVEGVTDVWRIGRQAVCTLGAAFTEPQATLFRRNFRKYSGVLLYDPDLKEKKGEREAARIDEVTQRLNEKLNSGFCRVELPEGTDPGSLDRDFLLAYITQEAEKQGVKVDWGRRE